MIDASVAIKWFIWEEGTHHAHELLDELTSFYAPDFFLMEIDSALTKKVRIRDLEIKEAFHKRSQFRKLPYKLINYTEIEEFAFRLAAEFSVTLYDAAYLATAIDYNAKLHTADLRLSNGMANTPFAKYVKYIGK
ncbi:MAG TPA: type II toxin-antitoxin system VapC family toxin [Fodinibius sp.]|nr:type II toxin-antitoxin system VapC family toxin [Fodinibius sp.]